MLFPKLFRPTARKNCSSDQFEIPGWKPRICKLFEITRTVYWNSEKSVQFLKHNAFLTCSWRFLRSNTSQQLKLENIRSHSTITWTEFCHFLTPSPPSCCLRSYWIAPNLVLETYRKRRYSMQELGLEIYRNDGLKGLFLMESKFWNAFLTENCSFRHWIVFF